MIILDTGPLIAFLNRKDIYHEWTQSQLKIIKQPLVTSESVISEACFLVQHAKQDVNSVFELLRRGLIQVNFNLQHELEHIHKLMRKFQNIPMSLADASLVRMTELHPKSEILTLDSDFRIYRTLDRRMVPVLMPS